MIPAALRHPVVHFLAIGALLFAVNAWRTQGQEDPETTRIVVDRPRLEALAGVWRAQFGRSPSRIELVHVAQAWADEEMRVREARRLGLDKDDSVIRRRLAEKYQFLVNNPSALPTPSDAVLKAYLAAHLDRYGLPSKCSFEQVFFSADRGRPQALAAAEAALADPGHAHGDDFPGDSIERDATPQEVRQDFGSNFAAALPKLKPGVWQGPVESGYGFHLVKITGRADPAPPDFAEVRGQVLADWLSDAASAAGAKADADLKSRYRVTIDDAAATGVAAKPMSK